jgi:hypothetical protein
MSQSKLIEERVDDLPDVDLARATAPLGGGDQRLQQFPLFVGEVGGEFFSQTRVTVRLV